MHFFTCRGLNSDGVVKRSYTKTKTLHHLKKLPTIRNGTTPVMSTSMNVYMNVLVLLPRLQIPIHFCSANSSSLQIIFTFPKRIWVISSSKKTYFFSVVMWFPPHFPTAVALDSHWSHASLLRLKFGPESPWNTRNPVGKHPVEDGRRKKKSFETENVNSHETPRWLQGAIWFDLVIWGEPVENYLCH